MRKKDREMANRKNGGVRRENKGKDELRRNERKEGNVGMSYEGRRTIKSKETKRERRMRKEGGGMQVIRRVRRGTRHKEEIKGRKVKMKRWKREENT